MFICEHSSSPSGTHFSVSEMSSENLRQDRLQSIWKNSMKLSESPVFTNVRISPVFQILDDNRQASRSSFIVNIFLFPIKLRMPLTYIRLIHDPFPIHFKLAPDFGRANIFGI
jgi:hypothetical protein